MITTLEPILKEHPFFQGFETEYLKLVTGCARNLRFEKGFLFREKAPADELFLIREGQLNLEVASRSGALVVETLNANDVVGWSWLIPPYRWHFDARIVTPLRVIALNGKCLRKKCEEDPRFGYEMMQRIAGLLLDRLQSTRLRLLEVYEETRAQ